MTQHNVQHKPMRRKILSAAVAGAAVGLLTSASALAQYSVGNDGRARDANNRLDSGGYNSANDIRRAVSGNQLVTGNVTGGREFRGFVPYTDPGAFRGTLSGASIDTFTRTSAGMPTGIYGNNNAQQVQAFYGQGYGAPPPPGFTNAVNASGQYIPVKPTARTSGDLRLGDPFDASVVQQPRPGQLILPGPVDTSNQPTVITASPLYGVRSWRFGESSDQEFLSNYTDLYSGTRRSSQLDDATVQRMRRELLQQTLPDARTPEADAQAPVEGKQGDTQNINQPLQKPFESADPALQNKPLESGVSSEPLSGDTIGQQGLRNRMLDPKANSPATYASNSPQYRELQKRLARYRQSEQQVSDADANREFQQQRREAEKAAKPGGVIPGGQPPSAGMPGADQPKTPAPGATPMPEPTPPIASAIKKPTEPLAGVQPAAPKTGAAQRNKPLVISSFAKDVSQSATSEMMKEAEELMKSGRYTSALDKYDLVEQVSPNDPLAMLGRATAELGASYYTRADTHLREAFTRNPALLMGQYDLRVLLGEERLNYLVKDLKDITRNEAKQTRPAFLLAYLFYNIGDERRAAGYLDLAEKRAGGQDPFFKLLREHWSLPSDVGPSEELNK